MDKRGITTLMALVLIFVLLLGGGILTYTFFFGPPVSEQECGLGIGWKMAVINGQEDLCYDAIRQRIRFTVENGLAVPLEGVYAKIESSTGGKTTEKSVLVEDAKTEKAGIAIGHLPFNPDVDGQLRAVTLLPVVTIDDGKVACLDEVMEKQGVNSCA